MVSRLARVSRSSLSHVAPPLGLLADPGPLARGGLRRALCSLPELTTTRTGLMYRDVHKPEHGARSAERGQTVAVHYTGRLDDGTVFDSSFDRGQPIEFELGAGRVIKGWDEGIAGMPVRGRRQLVIPAHLGYGARGAPPAIPPNALLHFDVELVSIQEPGSGLLGRFSGLLKALPFK